MELASCLACHLHLTADVIAPLDLGLSLVHSDFDSCATFAGRKKNTLGVNTMKNSGRFPDAKNGPVPACPTWGLYARCTAPTDISPGFGRVEKPATPLGPEL